MLQFRHCSYLPVRIHRLYCIFHTNLIPKEQNLHSSRRPGLLCQEYSLNYLQKPPSASSFPWGSSPSMATKYTCCSISSCCSSCYFFFGCDTCISAAYEFNTFSLCQSENADNNSSRSSRPPCNIIPTRIVVPTSTSAGGCYSNKFKPSIFRGNKCFRGFNYFYFEVACRRIWEHFGNNIGYLPGSPGRWFPSSQNDNKAAGAAVSCCHFSGHMVGLLDFRAGGKRCPRNPPYLYLHGAALIH